MYVFAFNFLGTLSKVPDLKVYMESQCVLNTYTLSRVYVPFSSLLQAKGLKLDRLEMWNDALLLEELSYRARIYVITNLEKNVVAQFLARNNIDVFIQDVISAEEVKRYKPSQEFFELLVRRANTVKGAITVVSSNPHDVLMAKSLGFKAYWLNRYSLEFPFPVNLQPDNVIKSLSTIVESTAQHKVDSSMGDSALRCT
ncbi:MAG: HAD hydrolase-like protein [Sulfolobus sp.]|nr:HAD hydrolase-like protein [Sulfolobus sp.]